MYSGGAVVKHPFGVRVVLVIIFFFCLCTTFSDSGCCIFDTTEKINEHKCLIFLMGFFNGGEQKKCYSFFHVFFFPRRREH